MHLFLQPMMVWASIARCIQKSFEEADIDRDGTLDREEAKAVCKEDFDLMDKDRDGTLTKEELNACKGKKGKSGHKKAAKPA
ncbi:MAG: hypothetical protein RI951_780 [Pseudomonadota bacterium]